MYLQQTGTNAVISNDSGAALNDTNGNLLLHPAYATGLFTIVASLPSPYYLLNFASPIVVPQQVTAPSIIKGTQPITGFATQDLKDAGRTIAIFYAGGVAAGATGVETLITLARAGISSANSFVIPNGKYFRLTNIIFASRGHNTATAQVSTFSLRYNTAGAITTASTLLLPGRVATPATANAYDRVMMQIPDGIEVVGNGTTQFGVTANAVYTTNAPTWDCVLIGFEY